jgi:hypothetical protein
VFRDVTPIINALDPEFGPLAKLMKHSDAQIDKIKGFKWEEDRK